MLIESTHFRLTYRYTGHITVRLPDQKIISLFDAFATYSSTITSTPTTEGSTHQTSEGKGGTTSAP